MSAARAARFSRVLPPPISVSTASLRKGAISSGVESEVREAHDLALIHRHAAEDLGEIFAKPDAGEELLRLAEPAFLAACARHKPPSP